MCAECASVINKLKKKKKQRIINKEQFYANYELLFVDELYTSDSSSGGDV